MLNLPKGYGLKNLSWANCWSVCAFGAQAIPVSISTVPIKSVCHRSNCGYRVRTAADVKTPQTSAMISWALLHVVTAIPVCTVGNRSFTETTEACHNQACNQGTSHLEHRAESTELKGWVTSCLARSRQRVLLSAFPPVCRLVKSNCRSQLVKRFRHEATKASSATHANLYLTCLTWTSAAHLRLCIFWAF